MHLHGVKSKTHAFSKFQPHDHRERGTIFRKLADMLHAIGDHEGSKAHERSAEYHFSQAERLTA